MTQCQLDTPCTPKRRRSFEVDHEAKANGHELNLAEEPVLIPLLEDLTIWLSGFLREEISPENFIELFQDGVLFCKLGKILHEKAEEYKSTTNHKYPLPSYKIKKWYENPKVGSFFCRDNVCKFITWCKQFGVSDYCLFESNDIVEHRTVRALRNVLVCLLDVGKIGVKHGIEPSELVRMDLEIEREIQQEILRVKTGAQAPPPPPPVMVTAGASAVAVPTSISRPKKSRIPRKNSSLNSSLASSSEPPTSEESEEEEAVLSSPEPDEEELERIRLKLLSLDEQVRAIVSRCTCKTPFQLDRVGDGKYKLPHTSQIFFVRILRNHVMVRVGGGWDTLDHFIAKHDPCRMKFKQIIEIPDTKAVKSKVDCYSTPRKTRNRSASMVTSPSGVDPPPQHWVQEDSSPLAKSPRQTPGQTGNFSRSASARFVRRLSYSSDSEDLNHVGQVRGGSDGSTSSLIDSEFDVIEDKTNIGSFSPLISFKRKGNKSATTPRRECDDSPLTLFSQTPKTSSPHNSRIPKPSPSMIPVPKSRSKSCERIKGCNVTMTTSSHLKHSKSTDLNRSNNIVMRPQRMASTPVTPSFLTKRQHEEQVKSCLGSKTPIPKSLLSNPTSATTKKVLRSKSSENISRHKVINTPSGIPRSRSKSGELDALNRVALARSGTKQPRMSGLKKSKSSDVNSRNVIRIPAQDDEIVMKPDLGALSGTPKSSKSFRDWLKKMKHDH